MSNTNHFSDKFEKKPSGELRNIIDDNCFQKDAKLAAIWELERRLESTEEHLAVANSIVAENEQSTVIRLASERYQTFWPRLFASIIDGFALWPIAFLLSFILNTNIAIIVIVGGLLNSLIPYVYSVLLHGYYGQTLGKMAMSVKVVNFDNEEEIDLKQALVRDIVPIVLTVVLFAYSLIFSETTNSTDLSTFVPIFFIGSLTLLWSILEIFSMLFDEKSRAVHDLIAKTVVVRTK